MKMTRSEFLKKSTHSTHKEYTEWVGRGGRSEGGEEACWNSNIISTIISSRPMSHASDSLSNFACACLSTPSPPSATMSLPAPPPLFNFNSVPININSHDIWRCTFSTTIWQQMRAHNQMNAQINKNTTAQQPVRVCSKSRYHVESDKHRECNR